MASEALKLQKEIRNASEDAKKAFADLYKWQGEMKEKENDLRKQNEEDSSQKIPEVRSLIADYEEDKSIDNNGRKEKEKKLLPQTNGINRVESLDIESRKEIAISLKDRGNNILKLEKYEEAIFCYTEAIENYNFDPVFYTNRALCYLKLERHEECIEDCNQAIVLDKNAVKAYYRRMQAYEYLGENEKALENCNEVLKIQPQNIEATKSYERISKRIETQQKKLKINENPISSMPVTVPLATATAPPKNEAEASESNSNSAKEIAICLKDKGNNHINSEEYEQAIYCYTQAIKNYNLDPIFYMNRSFCYLKLEQYKNSIEDCNKAIALDSNAVKAYYRRMLAYENLCEYEKALTDCRKILKLQPKNVEVNKIFHRIKRRIEAQDENRLKRCPSWKRFGSNAKPIKMITNKMPHLRSMRPIKRIKINEVFESEFKDNKEHENSPEISDEIIEKLFSQCDYNTSSPPSVQKRPKKKEDARKPLLTPNVQVVENISQIVNENKNGEEMVKDNIIMNEATKNVLNDEKNIQKSTEMTTNVQTLKDLRENNKNVAEKSKNILETVTAKELDEKLEKAIDVPKTSSEFYAIWKELSDRQKYQIFPNIPAKNINRILGAGLDCETFSGILKILKEFANHDKLTAGKILSELSKHSQIGIISMFLSADDRSALNEILMVMSSSEENKNQINSIKKIFNFKF